MWGNRGVQTALPSLKSYICSVTYKKFKSELISWKRGVGSYEHFCLTVQSLRFQSLRDPDIITDFYRKKKSTQETIKIPFGFPFLKMYFNCR